MNRHVAKLAGSNERARIKLRMHLMNTYEKVYKTRMNIHDANLPASNEYS